MSDAVKHTPGPWYIGDNGADGVKPRYWVVTNEETWVNRICAIPDYTEVNSLENARLIAAAPDMLHALKYVKRFLLEIDRELSFVDEAIAKAEGQ